MMMNGDALLRRFEPLIVSHCAIVYILHTIDIENRPDVYNEKSCMHDGKTKIEVREGDDRAVLPIVIKSIIDKTKYIVCT